MKTLAALLNLALWINFAGACGSRQPQFTSTNNSSRTAGQASEPQTQQQNWGPPFLGLRLSIGIEPAVADQTIARRLALTIHNSSEAEISFKPFISLQLSGASEDNSFWAPADLTMPQSDFPKRGFPRPPDGQPLITLMRGESKSFNLNFDELGWNTFKSSFYRGESFYKIVPAGKYNLVAAIELWDGQTKTSGQPAKIPKGSHVRSGQLKLSVSLQDSRKIVAAENKSAP